MEMSITSTGLLGQQSFLLKRWLVHKGEGGEKYQLPE